MSQNNQTCCEETSASRIRREQEAARDRLLHERAASKRAEADQLIKNSNETLRAARRMLGGVGAARANPFVYVIYVPATETEEAQIFGDEKGRPYRKMATAEGAAAAISSSACVKPIERW